VLFSGRRQNANTFRAWANQLTGRVLLDGMSDPADASTDGEENHALDSGQSKVDVRGVRRSWPTPP